MDWRRRSARLCEAQAAAGRRHPTPPRLAVVAVVLALAAFTADITIGCAPAYVYGVVAQKYASTGDRMTWILRIEDEFYPVPQDFYNRAQLGDTVKFDGRAWSIVKRAGPTLR